MTPLPPGAILADSTLKAALSSGQIVVRPLRPGAVGSNSIDVHLGRRLCVYDRHVLDPKVETPVRELLIPDEGLLLSAGCLYLGTTVEYTESHGLTPWLDGRSSPARLGICAHQTAGRGDVNFFGHWTLEISVLSSPLPLWRRLTERRIPWYQRPFHPGGVMVYPGMPIGQITYFTMHGAVEVPYTAKPGAKYAAGGESADPRPQPSRLWKSFRPKEGGDGATGDG